MLKNFAIIILAVCIISITTALYPYSYYNNYQQLIGNKAAGMGGAFTALADDSTALWYNPAGLARIKNPKLNVSGNSYSYLNKKTEGLVEFEKNSGDYAQANLSIKDYSIVANTLSFSYNTTSDQSLGVGIFVPYQNNLEGKIESSVTGPLFNSQFLVNLNINDKYYIGLVGYGIAITDWLNVGASLGLGYNKYVKDFSNKFYGTLRSTPADVLTIITDERTDKINYTMQGGIGAQVLITSFHSFGIYTQTPAYRITGSTESSRDYWLATNFSIPGTSIQNTTASTKLKYNNKQWGKALPGFVSLGYGYNRTGLGCFSIEVVPYFIAENRPKQAINYKAGFEVFLREHLILRGGLFTDFSQQGDIVLQSNNAAQTKELGGDKENVEKMDYYGGTLSISFGNTIFSGASTKGTALWTTIGVLHRIGIGNIMVEQYNRYFNGTSSIKRQTMHATSVYIAETVTF